MKKRERLIKAINHEKVDKVPVDLGATPQTGINASPLYQLRKLIQLEERAITVNEPLQLLGEVENDLLERLDIDVIGLFSPNNTFGIKNERFKPWKMPDGTPTLMAGDFQCDRKEDGSVYAYPQGKREYGYSLKLPAGGYFFDAIDRFSEVDEDQLTPKEDFKNDFTIIDEETAKYLEKQSNFLYNNTEYGIVANFGGVGLGDAGAMPGVFLKEAKGIRKMDDWLMAHILWPDYIHEVFELQVDIAIKNLEIYKQAVGDRAQVITVSGTDFGAQNNEIIAPDVFKTFYKHHYQRVNDWIHQNTKWKTFFHTCGSIANLLDDLYECGVDILNPVQCSAVGMEAEKLQAQYGDKFVFWGGGVDTQHTLPFGSKDEVRQEVTNRLEVFSENSGYVFAAIHNIVGKTPAENIMAMYEAIEKFNK